MKTPRFALTRLHLVLLVVLLTACTSSPILDATATTPVTATLSTDTTAPQQTSTTAAVIRETSPPPSNLVSVQYRATLVDLAAQQFDYLSTAGSSFVRGAWYDAANDYMIIRLDSTYYHYCGLPGSVWDAFSAASSFGSYYNGSIKGRFDCRGGYVPEYD